MSSAIPPSMYRHFAVVTLVLTFGLAMFAEGENLEARAVSSQAQRPAQPAQPARFAVASDVASSARGFARDVGDEFDNSFGRPMEQAVSAAGSGVIPDLESVSAPGYSPEYLASLSEEERQLLLQGLQDNGMLSPELRSQRSAALNAASERRSGRSAGSE